MNGTTTLDFSRIKDDTIGRWPGIFERLGISVGHGKHGPCPMCGGKDRFRFDDKEGKGTWICNQCGAGDGFSLIMKILNFDFKEACEELAKIMGTISRTIAHPEPQMTKEDFRKIFKESERIKDGDPVTEYLKNRGLSDFPSTLWHCPKCWEFETKTDQNAMIAVFSLPDSEAITIHRTYIKDGKKLDIESPRKVMPPLKKMTGGAVRLYEYTGGTLGICEGIETAIAVHEMFMIPVWACLSTSLMEGFKPPKTVERIEIYADNDANYAGAKAAYVLANRLVCRDKIPAFVLMAKTNNGDFLDDLNNMKGA